jgi:hypothetical protein
VSFPKACERVCVCVTSPDAQPRRRIQATAQVSPPKRTKRGQRSTLLFRRPLHSFTFTKQKTKTLAKPPV